jgi:hypothetical protein
VGEVRKVFDAPFSGREVARNRIQLRQDACTVPDYAVDFHTLAAEALFDMFLHSVSEEVKDEPCDLKATHRF